MFLGQYTHALDDKGRLTIPSRFRDDLAGRSVVITRGLDRCLTVYPLAVWEEIAQKVNALSITDPRGRALRRVFFADAMEADLDRQGRILVPDRLREYAGLEPTAEAVIVGLDRFMEVWSPQRWEETNAHQMELMDEDPALWENLQI
ncbi:MAG TPA: division/cell wall cluster transcriptional repressor MraZ [Anaerolineae bacterium]|nr:division/cell wall cluster transcriptional repressor MraZ [Anaerolineae bacterium]HQK14210.1 division/cell wall cluster transcriptional repressor MraZ [Anaerolineae bacterium]